MAGILNSKQRIMDVLVTSNGRRQIADGTFKIEYASFSDHGVFYRDDGTGIADDAGSRVMFESYASNSDVIIPEINSHNAVSMDTSSGKKIVDGSVVAEGDGSFHQRQAIFLSGSVDVFSSSNDVIQSAIDNFDRLQVIGTKNTSTGNEYFKLSPNEITFQPPEGLLSMNVNSIPAMWACEITNSQPQFKYMSPVYESDGFEYPMSTYTKLTSEPTKNFSELKSSIEGSAHSFSEVDISTSDSITNLLIQCFEIEESEIKKLVMINYGSFYDDAGVFQGSVYHLGKLYRDSQNIPKFIRLMSVLFE